MATLFTGTFELFEGQQNDNVSMSWSLTDTNTLTIFNEGNTGIVTQLNFEQDVEVSTSNWRWTEGNYNLPGGNNISFDSNQSFKARPSPVKNGIQTGGNLIFQFEDVPDVGRVAMHVQSIGQQGLSASYVSRVDSTATTIPEPSGAMLLGVVGVLALTKRKQ